MKDRKYFEEHVIMAVELDGDYGKHWSTMRGVEVKDFLDRMVDGETTYFSDLDYCTKQEDEWVRKVLNTAEYNWWHNRDWIKKVEIHSLWDLVEYIVDHGLVG